MLCRRGGLNTRAAASADRAGLAKPLARAVRAVPIKIITVAKNSSGPAEACACASNDMARMLDRLVLSASMLSQWQGRRASVPYLAGEWAAKLQRYTGVQQKRIAPNPKRSDAPAVAVRTEGEAVLKALAPSVCLKTLLGGPRFKVLPREPCSKALAS